MKARLTLICFASLASSRMPDEGLSSVQLPEASPFCLNILRVK